jgi:hypothetical protein
MSEHAVANFFRFARERYKIKLAKDAGKPAPWTKDPVLATAYFCNVFREDDRTTVWFREEVRNKLRNNQGSDGSTGYPPVSCSRMSSYVTAGTAQRYVNDCTRRKESYSLART